MSTEVRVFNPPSSRYRVPESQSGVYRPSFASHHRASDVVRERLVRLGIAKSSKGGRVLLNRGASAVATPPKAAKAKKPAKARRTRKPAAKAKPATKPKAVRKPKASKKSKAPAKGVSKACAKKGIMIPEAKAKQVLKDGQARGKPLTAKQRGLMGLVAGGCRTPKSPEKKARARKLDAERKAKTAKKPKAAKKPKTSKRKPKAAKKAPKRKKPAAKAKTAKKAARGRPAARRFKGSVQAKISATALVPVKKTAKKKTPARAASVPAKAAPKAKAANPARRNKVAKRKKHAKAKKSAAKAKKHNRRRKHAKKHAKAKKHNRKRRKHAKAKKHNKKRRKHAKKRNGGVLTTISENKGKRKKHNKKRARRRNSPEGTKKTLELLGVSDVSQIPNAIKRYVIADNSERRQRELNRKLEAVLNKLSKVGGYDRPKAVAKETLTDLLHQIGLGAGHHRATTKKRHKKAKKTASVAASVGKKHAKKSKSKKANKGKRGRPKGSKNKKKSKGSKKGAKKAKGKKHKKSSAARALARLAGSLRGQVELHEVRRKKGKRKAANQGGVLVSNGISGIVDTAKGFALEKVWSPVRRAATAVPGLAVGAGLTYAVPNLLMGDFVKRGIWQKALGSLVGGVTGIVATGIGASLIVSEEEASRQVYASALGALGAFVVSVLNKATAADNPIRKLTGTDPASLADYVGLSDSGDSVGPRQVREEPSGLQQASQPEADQWSSALDYGDARFDPLGFTPDSFSETFDNSSSDDMMGDFAAPASMADFAAPGMGDFAAPSGMGDELDDFAAPAMADFVGVE